MKHFVEMITHRPDGALVYWRELCRDWEEARARTIELAAAAVDDPLTLRVSGNSLYFTNDYGGETCIRPIAHGSQSQIREGIFVL
jgi:hypothetical protein